jgi:hypothetical protein
VKKLEAEAKRTLCLEEYRTRKMRQEMDMIVDMAWEVINFEYMIAAWRKDMDSVHFLSSLDTASTRMTATKGLEMEEVTVMLEGLWREEGQLEDNGIMMAELELDTYMVDLGLGMSNLSIKDKDTVMDMDILWEE